jgi:hypothetical protein
VALLTTIGDYTVVNKAKQIIGGYVGGLTAAMIGYATDAFISAMLDVLKDSLPMTAALGAAYTIISFILGLEEAWAAGICFSAGIISMGFALSDSMTFLLGTISIVGLAFSLLFRRSS